MQALAKKQLEEQKLRDILATDGTRSIEQRIEHCRVLQYEEHKAIFATSYSTIHKAAGDGSIDGLKFFLDGKRKPQVNIDDFDKYGFCPLHSAAIAGANHSISFLIERGCDPDVRSTYGDTALMHAVKGTRMDTIRLLVNLGATITPANKAGTSTCHTSLYIVNSSLLYRHIYVGFTAIHMAAQADNLEALTTLVELTCAKTDGEDGNQTARTVLDDDQTINSVSVASRNEDDSMSMVHSQFDYTQNAQVKEYLNLPSNNLTTPLHIACMNNSQRVVKFLLHHKVRIDFKDSSGDTALHKAGRKQLNRLYEMLIEAGASQSVKNNYGETPRDLLIDNPSY